MAEIRYMTEADLERVLSWRNHPDVRNMMYTRHEISWDEHCRWFSRMQEDRHAHLLIYEDEQPSGFVSFRTRENTSEAVWGFYLSPDAETGTGMRMGKSALQFAFSQLGYEVVIGEVIDFNQRSAAFHERLGFHRSGILHGKYHNDQKQHDVVQYRLTAGHWKETQGIHHD